MVEKIGVFIVLAEPGAGKTDLLNYFGRAHKVLCESASLFIHAPESTQSILIIDALDELARINEEKITEIIFKAQTSGAHKVILASRSYVWDEARTKVVQDCFRIKPTILRLEPFDSDEQRQLFLHHLPNEDFDSFCSEVERFELTPILGNPQFLLLLAEAYVQSGQRFTSKRQIYADAIRRLASESEQTAGMQGRPQTDKIVAVAGEVFAKLLLSGATGVSAIEQIGDDAYPYLQSVGPDDGILTFALNTRLFRPTVSVNRHEPIHRIVAEYCAADYLVKIIEDPTNIFSIKRCLAVIAPNGAVRNELRGLLGWMASLGGPLIQESVLDLDPYAVFANGDPSQLLPSSKQRLLKSLESLASIDPYFRRMDSWRRFSVAGFFSEDIIEDVRPLLAPAFSKSHLRGLLLELIQGADAVVSLQNELRAIMYDPNTGFNERKQAYQKLDSIPENYDIPDFDLLIGQASKDSLRIASEMVSKKGCNHFGMTRVRQLIKELAKLYPNDHASRRIIGSRYFIKQFLTTLDLNEVLYLLNEITSGIICTCGKEKPYQCTCRIGISKIAGHLLDRYFELMVGPHDPHQILKWVQLLIFRNQIDAEYSASVQALRSNSGLRRAIHIGAFDGLSTQEDINAARMEFLMRYRHSGLIIQVGDIRAIVDHAMVTRNNPLWEYFIEAHNPYAEPGGVNELRAHMRAQARQSAVLLQIWARVERDRRNHLRQQRGKFGRSNKSYEKKEEEIREKNFERLQQDRILIEAGQHWGWLKVFAGQYLHEPDKIEDIVDDPQTLEKALLNCFDFLAPHIPTLEKLSEQRGTAIPMVLQAACLATFRHKGVLEDIPFNILRAVKADGVGGDGYQEGEIERFEAELDRLIFPSDAEAITFARRYIEPQLTRTEDGYMGTYIIDHGTTFGSVKGKLALEWLTRYPEMPSTAREQLFGIAAAHADRAKLNDLIDARCNDPIDSSEAGEKRRQFWLLRHFFFIAPTSDTLWTEFSTDPKSIFPIENYAGRMSRHDNEGWPHLNAEQIYRVLDAFTTSWPKVDLPSSWGPGDPDNEKAYRFLRDIIYQIGEDAPSISIPVFDRILSDSRFSHFHNEIKSQKAEAVKQLAHIDYKPPRPAEISKLLDESKIASVEDMRALLIELLDEYQDRLNGAATNPVEVFYSGDERVDENTARDRIVEKLEERLNALHLGIVVEHQMRDAKRCDFTASTSIYGSQAILVTEVKGQWNRELYTAASAQLAERYMIYPGAADQGVYLVLWFGGDEKIAGKKNQSITSANELRQEIIASLPESLLGRIDVYVLDVSRQ
ncbi:MAG: hypothetical protein G3M70_05330 [Candidatus Nitronauta litoralis]|uniref:Uncharacterized protein n=1 Tax=Candidatus Nitronauta litoralis TaxID=2705533 RepID=A0A7T0BV06_9BACT|nr:MAG: hypothetical protein G3M70_05330 [Candidatus Nitronauta litoralis]